MIQGVKIRFLRRLHELTRDLIFGIVRCFASNECDVIMSAEVVRLSFVTVMAKGFQEFRAMVDVPEIKYKQLIKESVMWQRPEQTRESRGVDYRWLRLSNGQFSDQRLTDLRGNF